MITKLSIKLLQIIMYPQLKWYTKMCFCGNRTLVQMLLSDKFQKGCNLRFKIAREYTRIEIEVD